jgi:hypothetical protein
MLGYIDTALTSGKLHYYLLTYVPDAHYGSNLLAVLPARTAL